MELEKFARQLKLMLLLTQNHTMSVEEVGKRLGMSSRTIYRYIDAFKAMGFIVKKDGTRYSIDHSSPFFREISSGIRFTEDEALTIGYVLNSVFDNSVQVRHLREKLSNIYDIEVLARHGVDNHLAKNISTLFQAIREGRVAVLKNYRSPSSGKISDRIVEPYMFMNENNEVRCYEISSGTNKTFKVTRIEKVELVDLLWSHKKEHKAFYTDLFGFTGEERMKVTLRLGSLSTHILLEEYPDAHRQMSQIDETHQQLDTEVCSYVGIGRFVIGLYEDVEIIDSPEFEEYVTKRLHTLCEKHPIRQM